VAAGTPPTSLVTADDARRAREVIGTRLHRTPLVGSTWLGVASGTRVFLKLELFQKTGSFKPRGVLNALDALSEAERRRGVISLSAGNHAQAVAWAASAVHVQSTIVMPAGAVRSKVDATRGYGGEVVLTDGDLLATTLQLQRERRLTLIHPFDDPRIIAGHGTLALELLEDLPLVDVVLVGCGGGGLVSGVAAVVKALRPQTRVYAVEPSGASGMRQSFDRGMAVRLERVSTIADGLSAPFIGKHNYEHARAFVDDVLVVEDAEILEAMRILMQRCKVLPEPAGAAAAVPLLTGRLDLARGATVAIIVSGGNVDLTRLRDLL
jgi:threonine dehydratase